MELLNIARSMRAGTPARARRSLQSALAEALDPKLRGASGSVPFRTLAVLAALSVASSAATSNRARPAFPGATGEGAYALEGWPTTPTVCRVTTDADSGRGSVRDCVAADHRIVVCALPEGGDGTIELESNLDITHHHVLLDLRGCAGEGIQFVRHASFPKRQRNTLEISGRHVVVRGIRVRDAIRAECEPAPEPDVCFHGNNLVVDQGASDVVVANSSFAWASMVAIAIGDRTAENGPYRITFQENVVGDVLAPDDSSGFPGYGILNEGTDTTLYRNLLALVRSRLPNLTGAGVADVRENLFQSTAGGVMSILGDCDGSDGLPLRAALIDNIYERSSDLSLFERSSALRRGRFAIGVYKQRNCARHGCNGLEVYAEGNEAGQPAAAGGDSQSPLFYCAEQGVASGAGCADHDQSPCASPEQFRVRTPPKLERLRPALRPAEGLREVILASAGHPVRDSVDACLVEHVRKGTGATQRPRSGPRQRQVTGGCGPYDRLTAAAPCADSDTDGMCDAFERKFLGSLDASAVGDADADGFLNIEEELNGLDPTRDERAAESDPAGSRLSPGAGPAS